MLDLIGVPTGIRTPVSTVKGWCPRPLDDGDLELDSFVRRRGLSMHEIGGARRDRTADLLHAMQALSQLSYGPTGWKADKFRGRGRKASSAVGDPGPGGGVAGQRSDAVPLFREVVQPLAE